MVRGLKGVDEVDEVNWGGLRGDEDGEEAEGYLH